MSENKLKCDREIPVNIGHLPMRLRQKIVDQLQQEGTTVGAATGTGAVQIVEDEYVKRGAIRDGNQNIQRPLRFAKSPASTPIKVSVLPRKTSNKLLLKSHSSSQITATANPQPQVTDVSIPGILRIKAEERNVEKPSKAASSPRRQSPRLGAGDPAWFAKIYEKDLTFARELPTVHAQMNVIIQNRLYIQNCLEFNSLRKSLESIYTQFISQKIKFCCEQNIESFFWKLLYYNAIEFFKKTTISAKTENNYILTLIADGLEFYESLYAILKQKYLQASTREEDFSKRNEFLGKVSAQKILINLGDLNRYKEKFSRSVGDYNKAKAYYQKAQQLIPTNGIPYNQLAIVSIYMRNNLDAVYYHMRSLMSSNPIQSANESLKVFFDEIRKKYEECDSKSPERNLSNHNQQNAMRKEVWIYPDGARRLNRTDVDDEQVEELDNKLQNLPREELLKQFTSRYLYLIGKLFSGIGFEHFTSTLEKLLAMFKILLHDHPQCFSWKRFLKILALNIFVVEHNNTVTDSRREIRNRALHVMSLFFAFVVNSVNKQLMRLSLNKINASFKDISDDLTALLQYIKITCDWLSINPQFISDLPRDEQRNIDLYLELQNLTISLQKLSNESESVSSKYVSAVLDEDTFLSGFVPIASVPHIAVEYTNHKKCRIEAIIRFANCFLKNVPNNGVGNDNGEISLANRIRIKEINHKLEMLSLNQTVESIVENDENFDENSVKEALQLLKLRKELEEKSKLNQMYKDKLKQILQDGENAQCIEVRPKYLVPDTNCFIDSLDDLELLSKQYQRFYLIVPLIVVKELDGLSKGCTGEWKSKHHRIHHYDEVATLAKKSLQFIKSNSHVKCATTKGSILSSTMFALEDEENFSNDDKILSTALALQKESLLRGTKGGKSYIQTDLVLITTDRNLRVKAHSRNLIVSGLKEFLQWASNETRK